MVSGYPLSIQKIDAEFCNIEIHIACSHIIFLVPHSSHLRGIGSKVKPVRYAFAICEIVMHMKAANRWRNGFAVSDNDAKFVPAYLVMGVEDGNKAPARGNVCR